MKFLALGLLMFLQASPQNNANSVVVPEAPVTLVLPKGWSNPNAPQNSQQAVQIPQGESVPGNFLSGVITWAESTPPLKQSVMVPADWRCTTFNDDPREPTMVGVVCTKPVLVNAPKHK